MNEPMTNDLLARITAGLETTPRSIEELKQSLVERGYSPDADVSLFKQRLSRTIAKYTWRVAARAKQEAFGRRLETLVSWALRSTEEIDEAFRKLLSSRHVAGSQERIALAFRNLESISREDKIAILDDLALLRHDTDSQP